jgi:hypothetical protein
MSVCVQPVRLPGGDKTWTVLGADHHHVGPVDRSIPAVRIHDAVAVDAASIPGRDARRCRFRKWPRRAGESAVSYG